MLSVGLSGVQPPAMVLDKSILRLIAPHRLIEEIAEPGACPFMSIASPVNLDARERISPLQRAADGPRP